MWPWLLVGLGVVIWIAALFFAWALCVVAARADRKAGRMP